MYKDNYFYFILLCRVLVVSVSWFFEIFRVLVSRRVVSLCFLDQFYSRVMIFRLLFVKINFSLLT